MTEQALYNALKEYNGTITNKFSANWGSLQDFIEADDTSILARKTQKMIEDRNAKIKKRGNQNTDFTMNFIRQYQREQHQSFKRQILAKVNQMTTG